jgi:solute carrier family 36 (proton-coupled amino acid transporter)
MLVFSGNAVIMNVRAECLHKDKYPTILKFAIFYTVVLFMTFATICYVTYRKYTQDIFTMSLLPITLFTIFIRICTCFNALCSYPVQILAAFKIYENHPFFKTGSNLLMKAKKIITRSIIIWIITGVALVIPNFTDFLNIAGSISSAAIAFILPPLLYMVEFKGELSKPIVIINWLIVAFGVSGAIYSTYFSINQMINPDAPIPPKPDY